MSLSFLTPARTVLLISDEFLSVYTVGTSGVKLIDTVPWAAENFEENVAQIIAKDGGKKPVLMLNDMVEQHYRKEKILRAGVSVVDRAAIVKRKLNTAFANYPIRAAYPLKDGAAKGEPQAAADIYIFAAVASGEQVNKSIFAARKSLSSVAGFCLLPVESSDMVKALSMKYAPESKGGRQKDRWAVFIGQHRNGSLRQVLTKNGELALTRMSPIIEDDKDPAQWARELYQEFKATIGYLTRFGFNSNESALDVFVMANEAPGEALRSIFEEDCNLHIMDVEQAAQALGLKIGFQTDGRYADILHVAWAGRKNKFILPMKVSQIDEVSQPRQLAMLATLVLLASGAYLAYQTFSEAGYLAEAMNEISSLKTQKSQLDVQYQKEVQRLEEVGFDAKLVQSTISIKRRFEKETIDTLGVIKGAAEALENDLHFQTVDFERMAAPAQDPFAAPPDPSVEAPKIPLFEAHFKMSFPSTIDIIAGNKMVEDMSAQMATALPEYEVLVTKALRDYSYTTGMVVEAGDIDSGAAQQDFLAEISVKGAVADD